MSNVIQSMKKCFSSDKFPTTRSLLRSFLNKSTTTFRHFAAVVIAKVFQDHFSAHARKHNLALLGHPIKVIPPTKPFQLQELRTKKHFSKETTVKPGAWYIQSQVLQRREEEGGGGRGERKSLWCCPHRQKGQ